MAILKKPEPKKCKCATPPVTASDVSMLMDSFVHTSKVREEMNKVQLDITKADLRLHIAQADLAEITTARAKADLTELLASRKSRPTRM